MSELAWVKALPQISQTHGFSPRKQELQSLNNSKNVVVVVSVSDCQGSTCVNALVPLQSSRVTESSLTVDTDVRFLPTVDPQVSL